MLRTSVSRSAALQLHIFRTAGAAPCLRGVSSCRTFMATRASYSEALTSKPIDPPASSSAESPLREYLYRKARESVLHADRGNSAITTCVN